MEKEYLIVGSGMESKKSGKPYSIGKAIIKLPGKQFISDNDMTFLEDYIPVGEVVKITYTIEI